MYPRLFAILKELYKNTTLPYDEAEKRPKQRLAFVKWTREITFMHVFIEKCQHNNISIKFYYHFYYYYLQSITLEKRLQNCVNVFKTWGESCFFLDLFR